MKDVSFMILQVAAQSGPFFSSINLQTWIPHLKQGIISEAISEAISELYINHFKDEYYYFKSKNKFEHFNNSSNSQNRKRFIKERLQKLATGKKEPYDILAVMAMQIGVKDEAVNFWIKAAMDYMEYSAWFPANQCIENAKLLLLKDSRTEELKDIESLLKVMITEFNFLDPLHQQNKEKENLFNFPVLISDQISLQPIKNESDKIPHLEAVEKAYIEHVIKSVKGNKTKAARLLGVNRTTLIMRMKKMEMM